jgi:hypothetical protein
MRLVISGCATTTFPLKMASEAGYTNSYSSSKNQMGHKLYINKTHKYTLLVSIECIQLEQVPKNWVCEACLSSHRGRGGKLPWR